MQHFSWKIFPLLILLSCNNSGQSADDQLIVQAPKISLRAEPDEKSRELALISKGENLIDLQQVSLVAAGKCHTVRKRHESITIAREQYIVFSVVLYFLYAHI